MFSFEDQQYENFLADWSKVLLTAPLARSVYYVGASAWVPCDNWPLGLQLIPNFVVRTEDEYWESFTGGMPHGRARHDLINEVNQDALQAFYRRWQPTGWTNTPNDESGYVLVLNEPQSFIRVIEVPAASKWAGPEYLSRIPGGLSVEHSFQEVLRRYNPQTGQLDAAAHYWSCDERLMTNRS